MKLGLLAGNRRFPIWFSLKAKEKNPSLEIVAVGIRGETDSYLRKVVDRLYWVRVGELFRLIEIFKEEEIKKAVMVGQVSPFRIFRDRSSWDSLMREVLGRISDFRPHYVFPEIIKELEKNGLEFLSSLLYIEELLAKEGLNNNIKLECFREEEIDYYTDIARKIVDLDIGQTVIFKDKAIVAVEALEGTDATLRRGYRVCGRGFIVIKLCRKDQDLRFDVPVVGLKTINLLGRFKARALILQAGKTVILDRDKFLNYADRYGISVIGR